MDNPWTELQSTYLAASAAFLTFAEHLDDQQHTRTLTLEGWTAKEIAAHLAGWDVEAARRFRLYLAGPTPGIEYDLDAFNARSIAERRRLSWEETLADLRQAQAQLRQLMAQVTPEQAAAQKGFAGWTRVLAEHYEEHTAQLRV